MQAKTHVLEVLKQVRNSLTLAVSEDWLVKAIPGFACSDPVSTKSSFSKDLKLKYAKLGL